ncbi:dnaJ homolog subfamily C member 17-like [Phalaenopsis equestris]|uniref:dnaJ homolog subfamily C member 17-like n=1 Tax=Phalaenopsis equestris TaxID=78828 RepID=UPI0009E4FC3A|nr:dnaJ homolog subfamily C member 17-like [Phalaenopsis equestris]
MGRREVEEKAELVKEICFMATAFASCKHLCSNDREKVLIDWYLILNVDEDSGLDVIRRRYRQLALQLHPDKNNHPKAEVAFKLISEAYSCLSDKARRKIFNGERSSNFCKDCYLKWQSERHKKTSNNIKISKSNTSKKKEEEVDNNNNKNKPKLRRQQSLIERARKNHILQKLKQVQIKLREECRVIESCLQATMNKIGRESPLFDPISFSNYPYRRQTTELTKVSPAHSFSEPCTARGQESPVYEVRSDCWTRKPKPQFSKF